MSPHITVGSTVKYKTSFLNSIHTPTIDPLWRLTGTVIEIKEKPVKRAKVRWADQSESTALISNLQPGS